jgi:hypothetical protein
MKHTYHGVNHSAFFFFVATCFIICVATIWDMTTPQQLEDVIANFTQVASSRFEWPGDSRIGWPFGSLKNGDDSESSPGVCVA